MRFLIVFLSLFAVPDAGLAAEPLTLSPKVAVARALAANLQLRAAELEVKRAQMRLFWEGHLFHVENGSESFIGDVFQSVLQVPDVDLPVHLLHGRDDTTIAPATIQRFADQRGLSIDWIDGAGHTFPFSHWEEWLSRC